MLINFYKKVTLVFINNIKYNIIMLTSKKIIL